jgi:hypothetical protein
VLKGPYTAITVSVLVHLLLLIALVYSSNKPPTVIKEEKVKSTAIKSFLYTAPKKIAAKKVELKKTPPQKIIKNKPATSPQPQKIVKEIPVKPVTKTATTPAVKPATRIKPSQVTNAVKSETVTTKNKVSGKSRGGFSSYDRLSRLRNKLNNQQRDNAFAELTQRRSASIMDGEPFPVPKTTVPLTLEQQYEKNTSKSHVGSITKNDNGTCTIHREQILGSPVEATTSSFACGESKFDKSFREHMQKVQVKLGVKR